MSFFNVLSGLLAGSGGGGATPIRFLSSVNAGPQGSQPVNNIATGATTIQIVECVPFTVTVDSPAIYIGFPNWWIAPGSGITNPANSRTILAVTVEYGGTAAPIPVAFGGNAGATMAPGANLISDRLPATAFSLAKFSAGTSGWLKVQWQYTAASTDVTVYCGTAKGARSGSNRIYDPTKVNFTTGMNNNGAFAYTMINGGVNGTDAKSWANFSGGIVLGEHNATSFLIMGDSKTYGTGDVGTTIGAAGGNRILFSNPASLTGMRPGCNFGDPSGGAGDCYTPIGGATVAQLTYWYQYANFGIVGYGTNFTSTTTQTNLWAQLRANGIQNLIQRSLTPRTTATVAISSLTSVGTTATATIADTTSLQTGQTYPIAGATGATTAYNGSYVITVTNGTQFTYTFAGTGGVTATGSPTINDQFRTTQYQTLVAGWGSGQAADTFEAYCRGIVSTDPTFAYYQSQGERAATSGANYWLWKAGGTTPLLETIDGLHETGTASGSCGYEDNFGIAGTITTQAGGTVSTSLRAYVQALP